MLGAGGGGRGTNTVSELFEHAAILPFNGKKTRCIHYKVVRHQTGPDWPKCRQNEVFALL